ncbi:site-specific DNA-methyltransferase [Phocaeicola coprophilus]|uniref:site-specific DNA-methyltransferase n=1 Tax=Phocaeicola coprophilus TaxID=387090 RepID=UPI00266DC15B|nr:site-specific DNA-methyltransferase [Phocaeicola coprophilus]
MDKLKMQSLDVIGSNIKKIQQLFPNCVTERLGKDGKPELAIDFEKLQAELSNEIIGEGEERYQFTWPDKRAANRLANTPTTMTLRPCREESVDFDHTQNLYIEGDNLDVLKVLHETYLGKVKMIYIDPPYNTGNDFVYNDDFAQSRDEFEETSGLFDEEGNQTIDPMQRNTESNGRFHTDWLNMIYPRLKVARDLLMDDGVIFISIDDNEAENLMKICDEIFGEMNFVAQIPWRKRTAKSDVPFGISQDYEFIMCYTKSNKFCASIAGGERKYYETLDYPGRPWRVHDLTKQTTASERPNSFFTMTNPKTGDKYPANPNATWRITQDTFEDYYSQGRIVFPGDYDFLKIGKPVLRYWKEDDMKKAGEDFGRIAVSTKLPDIIGMSQDGTKEVTNLFDGKIFSFPKPSSLIKFFLNIINSKDSLVLDFFSGSATTAHAIMQLNAEDGGNRKFIMVQLPEKTDEKSEAYKAGYKNICEIGKERIRRAGKKIKEENKDKEGIEKLDTGFRVLKLDSSNMEDVYYTPQEFTMQSLFNENVKTDRTGEDLLFQVMLDLGIELSAKVETQQIAGKTVYLVDDNYLVACFDRDVTEAVVTEIAKLHPIYFVMRDASAANDNVIDNFEQLFEAYSKDTVRKIL